MIGMTLGQRKCGRILRSAAVLLMTAALATAGETTAVTGGTVMNASGEPMSGATVLIQDGVIAAIGTDVEVPFDAEVVDATGLVVFPGMILAHTQAGLDRPNESVSVVPYVDVRDALDPNDVAWEDALRNGITTAHVIQGNSTVISGMSRVVRPQGMMVEDMTVRPALALKIAISPKSGNNRMTQMAELRKAFDDLDRHVMAKAETKYEDDRKEADKKVLLPPEEAAAEGMKTLEVDDLDQKWRTLYRVKKGEIDLFVYCASAADVLRGLAWLGEMNLTEKATLVVGTEAHKVVDQIKASGRPVVLDGNLVHRTIDPLTGDEKETFVPKVFADAGIPFALQTYFGSMGEGYLWYQAARLVREGVSRDVALGSVTQVPADLLGLGDKLGSIAVGKTGNLVLLSGDPLAQATHVQKALLEGKVAYDRDQDRRLKELLTGEEQPVTTGDE